MLFLAETDLSSARVLCSDMPGCGRGGGCALGAPPPAPLPSLHHPGVLRQAGESIFIVIHSQQICIEITVTREVDWLSLNWSLNSKLDPPHPTRVTTSLRWAETFLSWTGTLLRPGKAKFKVNVNFVILLEVMWRSIMRSRLRSIWTEVRVCLKVRSMDRRIAGSEAFIISRFSSFAYLILLKTCDLMICGIGKTPSVILCSSQGCIFFRNNLGHQYGRLDLKCGRLHFIIKNYGYY